MLCDYKVCTSLCIGSYSERCVITATANHLKTEHRDELPLPCRVSPFFYSMFSGASDKSSSTC